MIKATIICDSISKEGIRITTFELEYPRIIHAELLTHSMLGRNSASSRAIPFAKMVQQLQGKPFRFGKNVAGMQDAGVFDNLIYGELPPETAWNCAKEDAIKWSKAFSDAGYHKQVFNRLTEPFQMMKTVITGTEWANFFWLRNDDAADPTLHELARLMYEEYTNGAPKVLKPGEWHLPYVDIWGYRHGVQYGDITESEILTYSLEDAIKVSAARCAAVSYRNVDYTLEKCIEMYDRLVGAERKHASAFAHQATPVAKGTHKNELGKAINLPEFIWTWEQGISHMDRDGQLWSAMMRGWIQYRKLIPGENYLGSV